MFRNKLTKWKAVVFRKIENRTFAARPLSTLNISTSLTSTTIAKTILSSSKIGSASKISIGIKDQIIKEYPRLYSTSSSTKIYLSPFITKAPFIKIELPPHEVILMPALSPTMTTGNIGTFLKKVGDSIQPGDVLCEIETDKAQMDFEVQEEGFLAKILIPEGTKDAEVGKPLAVFVTKKEHVDAFADYTGETESSKPEADEPAKEQVKELSNPQVPQAQSSQKPQSQQLHQLQIDSRVKASPLAKKLAEEKGVNLSGLKGSGPNGRIIKNDILSFKPSASPASTTATASETASKFIDLPLSNMRKVIASRLTESKQNIPHYYLKVDIEMDRIMELRSKFNSTQLLQETFGDFKLSVNDFIVKAAALALKKVPECNSAWYGDFVRQYENVDVCVAVATPSGLITPIVADADKKGLVSISGKVKELAARAKINKLKPEEYQGGTFTISNLGMYGVESFTAIINPPQSCILAVGATHPKLLPSINFETVFKVAQVMSVTLSCDHRVVDGATGAQWLAHFKRFLEEPEQMIL